MAENIKANDRKRETRAREKHEAADRKPTPADNEQGSGQGSATALAKMKMVERKKAQLRSGPDHHGGD